MKSKKMIKSTWIWRSPGTFFCPIGTKNGTIDVTKLVHKKFNKVIFLS